MVHRIAIVAGVAAAAVVLVISLAAASFNGSSRGPGAAALPAAAVDPASLEKTVTDTVYVKPVPTPKVIHVTKPAPGAGSYTRQTVVNRVASGYSGDDGGSGGGD
jgi:hypothetical protein